MATPALRRLLHGQQLVWVPLSRPDYVLLIVAGLHQVSPCVAFERTLALFLSLRSLLLLLCEKVMQIKCFLSAMMWI